MLFFKCALLLNRCFQKKKKNGRGILIKYIWKFLLAGLLSAFTMLLCTGDFQEVEVNMQLVLKYCEICVPDGTFIRTALLGQ